MLETPRWTPSTGSIWWDTSLLLKHSEEGRGRGSKFQGNTPFLCTEAGLSQPSRQNPLPRQLPPFHKQANKYYTWFFLCLVRMAAVKKKITRMHSNGDSWTWLVASKLVQDPSSLIRTPGPVPVGLWPAISTSNLSLRTWTYSPIYPWIVVLKSLRH